MKVSYELSVAADEDLTRIYRRGLQEFGETRADRYLQAFLDRFDLIAANPDLYPIADAVAPGLRYSVCGKDTIYYEVTETGIIIQFILGRQDIRRRIQQSRTPPKG